MPMRTRDLNSWLSISERNSGVAIEKSDFSMVPRRSGPSDARSMRSSVLPRPAIRYITERKGGAAPEQPRTRLDADFCDGRTSRVLFGNDHGDLVDLSECIG
jgi:hypothetical protein